MSEDRSEQPSRIPGLTNQERWDIRDHSKKYYPSDSQNTRAQVALEIHASRKIKQDVKKQETQAANAKQDLAVEIGKKLDQQEIVEKRLAEAERLLQEREASLVTRVVDFFRPKQIKQPLQAELVALPQEIDLTQAQIVELQRQEALLDAQTKKILQEKAQLADDKTTLERFYKGWGRDLGTKRELDALEEYRNREGSLDKIAGNYDCYFTHGIIPMNRVNGNNTVLNQYVPFDHRLALLDNLKPAISACAGKPNGLVNSWSPVGVICTGENGKVHSAGRGDRGTKARDWDKRVSGNDPTSVMKYKEGLEDAITTPLRSGINANELVINGNYDIAGLYLNLDASDIDVKRGVIDRTGGEPISLIRDGKRQTVDRMTFKDVFELAAQFEMPVYVFQKGMAHEAIFVPATGTIEVGEPVPPKAMVQRKYTPSPNVQNQLLSMTRQSLRWPGLARTLAA